MKLLQILQKCLDDWKDDHSTPARMLAHMLGVTYRKIGFVATPMYVNGSTGYLVAAEDIAEVHTDGAIRLDLDPHADLYEMEKNNERVMTSA